MNNKIHFHSLDALRFLAFFKVFLLHLPIQGDFPVFGYLKSGGGIGVAFFFVLSGFLITYLLVYDKINFGQINIRNFFMRRAFRIWPLFFLLVIIVFLLPFQFKDEIGLHMVSKGYEPQWQWSFTFTENYKMMMENNFPNTTPLSVFWSLCIEEHFYIVWMIMIFILPVKHILKFLLACFVISWICRYLEPFIWHNNYMTEKDLFTNIDFFAAGGLLGYAVARNYALISAKINSIPVWTKLVFIFSTVIIVVLQREILPATDAYCFNIFRPTIIALLFTAFIAMFIPKDSVIRIKSRILSYLGKISYGLYVFHLIIIHVMFQYCINHKIVLDNYGTLLVFIIISLTLSIIISAVSFKFFEKPMIRIGEKLSVKRKSSIS